MALIALERQLRRLRSRIDVYGDSRLNRWMVIDGVTHLNNAFGNPRRRPRRGEAPGVHP
jgi:hypothetical protein